MNKVIANLLNGKTENHLLPFFWQHGEEESVLRDYMRAISESGCGAVCVESRPHPDFCGDKWWRDMDVILDEARKRDMKVWVLDDAHFPTGFANGAVENAPAELCRQSICANKVEFGGEMRNVELELSGLIPPEFKPNLAETHVLPRMPKPRRFDDDKILSVTAFRADTGEYVDLTPFVEGWCLKWQKPAGNWTVWVVGLSRNCGPHRNYINMLDAESCKLLLDAVYEPHFEHYKDDFGKTIAGFFSDEPELGNGHLYDMDCKLGTENDFPFGNELPAELAKRLGEDWAAKMFLLWEKVADRAETSNVRYAFMDAVTSLVAKNFSWQIGDWCRNHGVEYIGHVVEDAGAHSRTAASLGHYFRGLSGQDMSGIDDIGGQVYPGGEDDTAPDMMGKNRAAEFYHFTLGRLASSAAAIEPLKKGRAMCEIFGNYGWEEGVRLEKYLADHFMVRGVNYFVPHAFSPKAFPDSDCPPHFYAHGHNPQFRHFGALMRYMNRVCTLISSGERVSEAAVLYHAESEWRGECMPCDKPARILEENQIGFDIVPEDMLKSPEKYNKRGYKAIIVPYAEFAPEALKNADVPVIYLNESADGLLAALREKGIGEIIAEPASKQLRVSRMIGENDVYFFVNEAAQTYKGTIKLPSCGCCYAYDAWNNRLETVETESRDNGTRVAVTIEPLKSLFIVFGEPSAKLSAPIKSGRVEIPLKNFKRSVCESIDYPNFGQETPVALPDKLAEESPEFSGFVRYSTVFDYSDTDSLTLVITDAHEGVEVFVSGQSAGIQIAPPFRYDISKLAKTGGNEIAIEVATTLERKCYPLLDPMRKMMVKPPSAKSGITGKVTLYKGASDE